MPASFIVSARLIGARFFSSVLGPAGTYTYEVVETVKGSLKPGERIDVFYLGGPFKDSYSEELLLPTGTQLERPAEMAVLFLNWIVDRQGYDRVHFRNQYLVDGKGANRGNRCRRGQWVGRQDPGRVPRRRTRRVRETTVGCRSRPLTTAAAGIARPGRSSRPAAPPARPVRGAAAMAAILETEACQFAV